jgi:hypothetical protein
MLERSTSRFMGSHRCRPYVTIPDGQIPGPASSARGRRGSCGLAGLALVDAVGQLSAPERLRVRSGVATGPVVANSSARAQHRSKRSSARRRISPPALSQTRRGRSPGRLIWLEECEKLLPASEYTPTANLKTRQKDGKCATFQVFSKLLGQIAGVTEPKRSFGGWRGTMRTEVAFSIPANPTPRGPPCQMYPTD